MIYALWYQDYDYAGFGLVCGQPDADMKALNEEFRSLPWEAMEKWHVSTHSYSPGEVTHINAFIDWLVAEKGFTKPEYRRVEV